MVWNVIITLAYLLNSSVAFGSWFGHIVDWEQAVLDNRDYPIHQICYEELKRVCIQIKYFFRPNVLIFYLFMHENMFWVLIRNALARRF